MRGVLLCLLLAPGPAGAGEILASSVRHEAGVYRLSVTAGIDAPLATVYRSITDYDNLAAINPSIVASRAFATADPPTQRVRSGTEGWILVFCKPGVHKEPGGQVNSRTI